MKRKLALLLLTVTVLSGCGKEEVKEPVIDTIVFSTPAPTEAPTHNVGNPEISMRDPHTYSPTLSEEGEYPLVFDSGGSEGTLFSDWFEYTVENDMQYMYLDAVALGIAKLYDYNVPNTWKCSYPEDLLGYGENNSMIMQATADCGTVTVVFDWRESKVSVYVTSGEVNGIKAEDHEFNVEILKEK